MLDLKHWTVILQALFLIACNVDDAPKLFQPPATANPGASGYPKQPDGTYALARAGDVELRFDSRLRTPVSTMRECRRWVLACFDQRQGDLDECFDRSPRCTTEKPWETGTACCPDACVQSYRNEREALGPWKAFVSIVQRAECFPGVQAYVNGGQP
jgi:hypothetical protein